MALNLGVVTPKEVILNFQGGRDEIGFTNLFIFIFIYCYADNIIDLDLITVWGENEYSLTCIAFRMTLSAAVIYINIPFFLGAGGHRTLKNVEWGYEREKVQHHWAIIMFYWIRVDTWIRVVHI